MIRERLRIEPQKAIGVPVEGSSTLRDGGLKGENRDSPPSFRAIGFANAQDINQEVIHADFSVNHWRMKNEE